jgi:hypothetical protein
MTVKAFSLNKWILVALVVLCWALAASFMAGYYEYRYTDLLAKVKTSIITASLGINYGNGSSIIWFNNTRINAGSTLLNLTQLLASVDYTSSPLEGAFVNAIDGVHNSNPKYWLSFSYSSFGWMSISVGCDKYIVGENETLVWSRQVYSSSLVLSP